MADALAAQVPPGQTALTNITVRKLERLLAEAFAAGVIKERRRNESIVAEQAARAKAARNNALRNLIPDFVLAALVVAGLSILFGIRLKNEEDLFVGFSLIATALIFWRHRKTLFPRQ
jgi:hypothetical protein